MERRDKKATTRAVQIYIYTTIITLLVFITVERQWVIAVQYGLILRRDGLFPGGTKEHAKKWKFNTKAHTPRG